MPDPKPQAAGERCDAAVQPLADLDALDDSPVVRDGGATRLRGSRSASSGVACFPAAAVCPRTGARDMSPAEFGPAGTLYSFSTLHVSSRFPTPRTMGYVDLPDSDADPDLDLDPNDGGRVVRVLAEVRGKIDALHCDAAVGLHSDADGRWWVEAVAP